MLKLIKAGFIWIGIALSFASYGQYSRYGQYYENGPLGALPMLYNPAFAGEAEDPRISSNFSFARNEFNINSMRQHSNSFRFATSYDQFIPAIRSGIGMTAGWKGKENFIGSYSTYTARDISLIIAPKFSIQGKYTLSPAVDFTYGSSTYSEKDFPEYSGKHEWVRSRVGVLFNTNKYYIGYSVDWLDKNYNYFRSYLQMGYTYQRSSESKFSFTPQLAFRIRDNKINLGSGPQHIGPIVKLSDINLNFRYKQFIWGWSNVGYHVGWQTEKVRLMAGVSVRRLFTKNYYDPIFGNLSFRYIFKQPE